MFISRITWVLLGTLIAGTICGCGRGGPGAQISGTVTLDGKPIPSGTIAFIPTVGIGGKSTTGKITGGKYETTQEQEVVGKHRVEIRGIRPIGGTLPAVPPPPFGAAGPAEQYVPECYNRASVLTFDIEPGTNTANFALKSSGR